MSFRHHPDGRIHIGNESIPLGMFLLDEPGYSLPAGMIAREYVPGVRHTLYDGISQHAGPLPWAEGDAYIANVATYVARVSGPLTLVDAKLAAYRAIDDAAGAARARYLTISYGQEATYLLKAADAEKYRDAGYPDVSINQYPWVKAKARSTAATPGATEYQGAADEILATRDAWLTIGTEIERLREAGKHDVQFALDNAEVDAITAATVSVLVSI